MSSRLRRLVPDRWAAVAPLVFAVAGLLATTSAQTAHGTDLRSEGRTSTADLIREQQHRAQVQEAEVARLQQQVADAAQRAAPADSELAGLGRQATRLASAAGTTAVRGDAVQVELDDAPHHGQLPDGYTADDLVVHQQDVQAVVNALWAGGAEAMTLMDQRVVSTSAVRCVGNVLILQDRVYSPPYRVTAIGDPDRLRRALDDAPGVQAYLVDAEVVGLEYTVRRLPETTMPGYQGSLLLQHARALP